jgi:hypothetical protein
MSDDRFEILDTYDDMEQFFYREFRELQSVNGN